MSKNFIHSVIIGLAVAAASFGCTQAQASDLTEAAAQVQFEKIYVERNVSTDVSEYGASVALPDSYFLEVKHDTTKHTAGTLGKTIQISDDFTFVPSAEYGIYEGDVNTDHETYFQGIVEYMPFAKLYSYAGAGYSFMNEGQDYSKIKAGVSYEIHPEMTVGYNFTRKTQHERTDFSLGLPTSNEHEIAMTLTGELFQPYVKLRHTVTTGVGYDNSAVAGIALVF
ncbi:hypothetical protein Ah1_00115 [Aeromonas phage Ah1]|uniref:Uncharacterized protein n=1 Tax=Aeromonas phage Ah1 TaxID=2053701 RepID=A0A2H4YFD6_9CAUD|nr:hypothetical protein KNT77_gp115 [Aeromonas phage Ah1]AUE22656.1 hypothetical protein Ah1_00115 [Aeromonas phage Ah1]